MGRVLKALRLLQPRQQNSGAGAVQVDHAGRDVRVQQVTQHQPVTHVHLTQHIYAGPPPSPTQSQSAQRAAPTPVPASYLSWRPNRPRPGAAAEPVAAPAGGLQRNPKVQHRETLKLMDGLSAERRGAVLDFMRREFGTARVVKLDADQCYRLKRYVMKVLESQ